ncbi:cation transporter [Succinimonas amylolytica]|uniref:cation transporter n=1 Tax=Succinimonas amylolytica TaxID=83769 RepID=UPI0003788215|nr:cation transporter [Succinimonas amylolytica]
MEKIYKIMTDCANCALKMETAARKTPGVKRVSVSFMALRMAVEFSEPADGSLPDTATIMEEVRKNCKKAVPDSEIFL